MRHLIIIVLLFPHFFCDALLKYSQIQPIVSAPGRQRSPIGSYVRQDIGYYDFVPFHRFWTVPDSACHCQHIDEHDVFIKFQPGILHWGRLLSSLYLGWRSWRPRRVTSLAAVAANIANSTSWYCAINMNFSKTFDAPSAEKTERIFQPRLASCHSLLPTPPQ